MVLEIFYFNVSQTSVSRSLLLKDKFLSNVKYEIMCINILFTFLQRENIKLFMFKDCKRPQSPKLSLIRAI